MQTFDFVAKVLKTAFSWYLKKMFENVKQYYEL